MINLDMAIMQMAEYSGLPLFFVDVIVSALIGVMIAYVLFLLTYRLLIWAMGFGDD